MVEIGNLLTLEKGSIQSSKVVEEVEGNAHMVTLAKNHLEYKKLHIISYQVKMCSLVQLILENNLQCGIMKETVIGLTSSYIAN